MASQLLPRSPRGWNSGPTRLYGSKGCIFRSIAARFAADPSALPSDFVSRTNAKKCADDVIRILKDAGIHRFGVRIHHAGDYPISLRDARHPIELLYYQGAWELTEKRCVAVVGSRKASEDGVRRAQRLARELAERKFAVVSGLATIDTAAHTAALDEGGVTIAVIGTPLGTYTRRKTERFRTGLQAIFCSSRRFRYCAIAIKPFRKIVCSFRNAT